MSLKGHRERRQGAGRGLQKTILMVAAAVLSDMVRVRGQRSGVREQS